MPPEQTQDASANRWGSLGIAERTLDKGRPPPGGEEARVVVYQPRGVGLMHTRP